MKITDPDYILPEILALGHLSALPGGTTLPMVIRGICKANNNKGDYVIKYISAPRMNCNACCRELVASFIAQEMGLVTPNPVIIDVTQDYIETLRGDDSFKLVSDSKGQNFGAEFLQGLIPFINGQNITDVQFQSATDIFAFDILTLNTDRRTDKHNLATDGKENMIIYDHELSFGFVHEIFTNPTPWLIKESEMTWITNHVFYNYLKDKKPDFGTFIDKLDRIDDTFWGKALSMIPTHWQNDQLDKIKHHFDSLSNNKDVFLQQLNKLVS
ncbi:HipA family kinase [Chryseobacterium sp. JK1]|uniref:HipA family kinase n=1 Tax=Chryseobacterium sp. JK1 TaxID=874294 RepID=UPI003D69EC39